MKILVIQQKMIGDVLISSIICNNLRAEYPNAQIDYLVYEATTPVLVGNPNIDNIILFQEKHRNSKIELLKLALEIRKTQYDLVIDAYSKLESWIIVLFSNAKRRISYQKPGRNFLYTQTIPMEEFPKTNLGLAIERRLSLLEPLKLISKIDPIPKLYVTENDTLKAKKLFEKHQVNPHRKTVMISLLGSEALKTYPLEYMAKVVDTVAETLDANILFNYFPKQIEQAKAVFNACKPTTQELIYFDLLGNDLREFIALMSHCDIIIGNDGGAINMAKSLGKPSFIIFSPWIEKKIWATFEDNFHHVSVHLKDYKPQFLDSFSEKELKKKSLELYLEFEPNLFKNKLIEFIKNNTSHHIVKEITIKKNNKTPFTAIVITYNEEHNIESTIKNLEFANEILIVDSYSTDQTVALASKFKSVKTIQQTFENFAKQRNFAIRQASHSWILFLDADERISSELKDEIIATVANPKFPAYTINRKFMFESQPLHFSGWQTDKIERLFNKENATYNEQKTVHEKLIVKGAIGNLKNKLIHYSYSDYASYKKKMKIYGHYKAQEEFKKGTQPHFFHFYIRPIYQFLYQYIIRFGLLDGKKGIVICYLNAYSVYVRFQELQKMRRN